MHTKYLILSLSLTGVKLAAKDGFLQGGKSDPFFELWDVTREDVNAWKDWDFQDSFAKVRDNVCVCVCVCVCVYVWTQ